MSQLDLRTKECTNEVIDCCPACLGAVIWIDEHLARTVIPVFQLRPRPLHQFDAISHTGFVAWFGMFDEEQLKNYLKRDVKS